MSYTNRNFIWDLDGFKRFYDTYVVKWLNAAVSWTSLLKEQARQNLGLGSVSTKDIASSGNASSTQVVMGNDTRLSVATPSTSGTGGTNGLLSASDKEKLNGISTGALPHIAPTTAEVKSALGTGNGTSKYLREDGTWVTPPTGGGAAYVPTLNAAPTSSTTTYTKDGQTVDFEVGQFARVANANAVLGYDFYQMYNVSSGTASWRKIPDGVACLEDADSSATIPSFDAYTDTVWNKQQTLSSAQKAQVKTNLDIVDIVFNTAYNASSNKAATMADIPSSLPANGGNAATVNNHTVLSDVPANAVFTDTTYSAATTSAAGLMSAADKTKADNTLVLNNNNTTTGSLQLAANTFYSLGTLTGALTVTLGSVASGIQTTYGMEFDVVDSAATPTMVPSFPASVVWQTEPVWTTNKHYEVSIRYNANKAKYYGICVEFDMAS